SRRAAPPRARLRAHVSARGRGAAPPAPPSPRYGSAKASSWSTTRTDGCSCREPPPIRSSRVYTAASEPHGPASAVGRGLRVVVVDRGHDEDDGTAQGERAGGEGDAVGRGSEVDGAVVQRLASL